MPSEYDQLFADSRSLLLLHQGESMTVTAPGGSASTVTGILTQLDGKQMVSDDGVTLDYHATAQVSLADVPDPNNQYKITARGIIYKVVDVEKEAGVAILLLFKQKVLEMSRGMRGSY